MKPDRVLDCRGNSCPLPVVKTKLLLDELDGGEILEVIADDPASKSDFPAWCEANEVELLEIIEEGGVFHFFIRKGF